MKTQVHHFGLRLLLIILALAIGRDAKPGNFIEVDGLLYDLTADWAFLISPADKSITSCVIPDQIVYRDPGTNLDKTYRVTRIAGVEVAGGHRHGAFEGCSQLRKVTIQATHISSIPNHTFGGCSSLEDIRIPDNILEIGDSAFTDCKSLAGVSIGSGVKRIGFDAFRGCGNLRNIKIPANVTEMEGGTFASCGLTSIEFSPSMKELHGFFADCKSLETVAIPECVEVLSSTFSGCTALKTVTFKGNKLKDISGAFRNCKSLETMTNLPESVINICYAFAGCDKLTSVNLPKNLTEIKYNAFDSCLSLSTLNLKHVKRIEEFAFRACASLSKLDFCEVEEIQDWSVYNGCSGVKEVILSPKAKKVPAFYGCTNIDTIYIPSGVEQLGGFNGCKKLRTINCPATVTSVGNIYGCTILENLIFSDNTISIGEIRDCDKLQAFVIPGSVRQMAHIEGCKSLREIHVKALTPPVFPTSSGIQMGGKDPIIYIPKGTKAVYEKAWYSYTPYKIFIEEASMPFPVDYSGLKYIKKPSVDVVPDNRMLSITLVPFDGYSLPHISKLTIMQGDYTMDYTQSLFTYNEETGDLVIPHITDTVRIFATGLSRDSTLKSITYQLGLLADPIEVPDFKPDKSVYEVILPVSTADGTEILVKGVPGNTGATLEPSAQVRCVMEKGAASVKINVIAEDVSRRSSYIVYFRRTGLTPITYPVTYERSHIMIPDSVERVLAMDTLRLHLMPEDGYRLPDTVSVKMGMTILDRDSDYVYNKKKGLLTIPFITGNVHITAKAQYLPLIPDTSTDEIIIKSDSTFTEGNVTDKYDGSLGTEENTTLIGKLTIDPEIVAPITIAMKNVVVGTGNTTGGPELSIPENTNITLSLWGENSLGYVENRGTLIVVSDKDAALDLQNTVVNNGGIFADSTGLVKDVEGEASLSIQDQLNENVWIANASIGESYAVTFVWEQKTNNGWVQVKDPVVKTSGSSMKESIWRSGASVSDQFIATGSGLYRCIIKNVINEVSTTLVTYADITVKGEDPILTYYTITLPSLLGATTNPNAGSYKVVKGSDFSFSLTLDKEYDQSKAIVKIDGLEIEPDVEGVYLIKNIQSDKSVMITGIQKNSTVSNTNIESMDIKVWALNGILHLYTPQEENIRILNFGGYLYKEIRTSGGETSLMIPKGTYIVLVGDRSFKIAI